MEKKSSSSTQLLYIRKVDTNKVRPIIISIINLFKNWFKNFIF